MLRSIDIPLNWSSRSSRFLGEERREEERGEKGGEERGRRDKEREGKRKKRGQGKWRRGKETEHREENEDQETDHGFHTPHSLTALTDINHTRYFCLLLWLEPRTLYNGLICMHSLSTQEDTHTLKTVVPS